MIEVNSPEISVDEIMEKIRKEVARRRSNLAEPAKPSPARDVPQAEPLKPVLLPRMNSHPQFEIKEDGYHFNDFLQFHDRDFIVNAYKGLLKRAPDNDGLSNYLDQLRQGIHSKIEILGRLRYSPEGKTKKVKVKGLLFPLGVAQTYRLPLLGHLMRFATATIRLPTILKNLVQFQTHIMALHTQLQDHLHEVVEKMENALAMHAENIMSVESKKAEAEDVASQRETLLSIQGKLTELSSSIGNLHKLKAEKADLAAVRKELEESLNQRLSEHAEHMSGFEESISESLSERDKKIVVLKTSVDQKVHYQNSLIAGLEVTVNQGLAKQVKRISGFEESVNESLSERDKKIVALETSVDQKVHDQDNLISALESSVNQGLADLDKLVAGLEESFSGKFGKWNNRIAALDKKISSLNSNIVWQERSLSTFLEREKKLKTQGEEDLRLSEPFYVSFEDRFRGTRKDIKDRLRIYLPIVQDATAGTGERPVLDVGCGRGEWIELLIEQGLVVHGLELNHILAKHCCEKGMGVVQGDVIEYLQTLPDNSLGAVTGFHVIEHLPFIALIKLFDETIRVLKPGGLVIFETPNPESILVGACNFYLDPTHCAPLPAPMIKFLAESRGLCRVEIKPLHPFDDEFKIKNDDSDLAKRFNTYFYGPQDYAAIGYKS